MENFNNIYADNYDKVLGWIKYKVGSIEIAEELAQDVFMKVHNNLTDFDSERSAVGTCIMNITKNTIIVHWRTEKKGLIVSIEEFQDEEGKDMLQPSTGYDPENDMINNELGDSIMNAIIDLPQKYQTIVDMFLIDQRSHEEISVDLNLPIGSVKAMIHRAKKLLKTRLSNF